MPNKELILKIELAQKALAELLYFKEIKEIHYYRGFVSETIDELEKLRGEL